VDGDDLDAVVEASGRLLHEARAQRRPSVLEAMTYRYRGHSVADAGLAYRTKEQIAARMARDPIVRVRERLRADGVSDEDLDAIDGEADARVAAAVEFALNSPEPRETALQQACTGRGPPPSSRACGAVPRSARKG
jgi:pyruvate dehydrogenase E1 component alpha subunit